jgi:hypothetical protein
MGNRAYVVFTEKQGDRQRFSPAVYLHWNGGPESIYQFLAELDRRGCRGDVAYRSARFCGVVADFFGDGGQSLGVDNGPSNLTATEIEPFVSGQDNGLYVVGHDAMRRFKTGHTGKVIELTADEVAREKAAALADDYADPDKGIPADFGRLAAVKDAARVDDDGAGDDDQTEAEAEAEKTEAAEAARAMTGAVMAGAFLQV